MTPAEVEAKLREKHAYEVAHYPPADPLYLAAADALAAQAVELERMRQALEIIAGKRPCIDNLMGNADLARQALSVKAG